MLVSCCSNRGAFADTDSVQLQIFPNILTIYLLEVNRLSERARQGSPKHAKPAGRGHGCCTGQRGIHRLRDDERLIRTDERKSLFGRCWNDGEDVNLLRLRVRCIAHTVSAVRFLSDLFQR